MPAGLLCAFDPCRRPVTPAEDGKRVEVHRVAGQLVPFGPGLDAGTVEDATGPLVRIYHGVCYWRLDKRRRISAVRSADQSGHPGSGPGTCDAEDSEGVFVRDSGGAGEAPD